jgi:hypothetical protein
LGAPRRSARRLPHHGWIHLGLGAVGSIDRFEVRWPDGTAESFGGADAGTMVELRRGEGQP